MKVDHLTKHLNIYNMGAKKARRLQRQAQAQADRQFDYNTELQREAMAKYEARQADYEQMQFFNPYDNMQNYYADLKNAYEGMENRFEELQVSTAAADFQMEQSAQQRSDILQALTGAAGTSGIAGLAQTLANQNMLKNAKISADIAKQEGANRLAAAKGSLSVELAEAKGEAMRQNMEASKQATLLGMQQAVTGVAASNMSQAQSNQMSASLYGTQLRNQATQTMLSAFSSAPVQDFLNGLGE